MDSMLDRRTLLKLGAAGAAALAVPTALGRRAGQAQARRHPHHRPEPRRRYALSRPVHRVVGHRDQSPALRRPGAPRLPDEDPARARRALGDVGGWPHVDLLPQEERQVPLRRAAHRTGREGPFRPLDRSQGSVPDAREGGQPGRDTRGGRAHRGLQAQEPDARLPQQRQPDRVVVCQHPPRQARGAVRPGLRRRPRERVRHRAVSAQGVVEGRPDGAGAPRRLCVGLARL